LADSLFGTEKEVNIARQIYFAALLQSVILFYLSLIIAVVCRIIRLIFGIGAAE
jgi:hypothetical protein